MSDNKELCTAMNAVDLILNGLNAGMAGRIAEQWEAKCAEVAALRCSAVSEPVAMEGKRDAVVQAIHKHVGIRQRVNVDLTGIEDAADAILSILTLPQSAPTDRQLWEMGCLTRALTASWTDDDLAKHSAGIRKTLKTLFELLDARCQAVNAPALDAATVEACAKFIEQHQETIREAATGTERYLAPRKVGNLMGVAYVDGLRALTRPQCEGK